MLSWQQIQQHMTENTELQHMLKQILSTPYGQINQPNFINDFLRQLEPFTENREVFALHYAISHLPYKIIISPGVLEGLIKPLL